MQKEKNYNGKNSSKPSNRTLEEEVEYSEIQKLCYSKGWKLK